MKLNAVVLVGIVGLCSFQAQASASGADAECDVDVAMRQTNERMKELTNSGFDNNRNEVINAPTVKDASCLPIFDDLDGLIRVRVPDFGGAGGIMSKVRAYACKMADGVIRQAASRATASVGDPYGVVSVGVGSTTGEGGVQTETYDIGKVVEQAATGAIGQGGSVIRGEAGAVVNEIPRGPIDRRPSIEGTIRNGANDAIKGL